MRDTLYEQVGRIGKALASPKRLELIELLCQSEKTVDALAETARCSVKLASAHLKVLRAARLVEARRNGKYVYYRLADAQVADLWVSLRALAEERLLELQTALREFAAPGQALEGADRRTLLRRAARGEIVVIDVRPTEEYAAGHLPCARSMPLAELRARLRELPKNKPVVAYCRGPFCLMSGEAVALLKKRGYRATQLVDGVAEWRAQGLPVET
ncbi:MAG: transcriptional regulator [Candidatus Desulfobacillus denitrificans]|jgi:rhodanese-related sulfurtransferase|uniref:ArsR family transcriptional regulator n=1 Tax=Candidatus Desulfobacillus denitrificans TaxID=2608985 RepID=A0A809RM47_9PROT|nr:metalloregulator ArsR/SmtB family transcription factor [Zoogloeaceae bacterium]OQY70070.1 MAG: ArsR family transcriptional regulator [Rhodocyclaceae bacterium UTPRO2]BBO20582.1 ArsR family transcriptional regulator [Candidatus Desulfobacillus denitrificans]GIK44150.1 MAG: ArsR family transcriptional regulator [Betaproteobacteria bacterium]GJQ55117.1 MAG: ArsR family transcriptional regulator [Rhodocyclaceae bacterium]